MSRMGNRYEDILAQRAGGVELPARLGGASGYFSKPTPDLDPRLFPRGSDRLYPEVRVWVLSTLYRYWETQYAYPHTWSTVWIAGSGITHQWSGGRSAGDTPGDLDVLIGVNWPAFFRENPRYVGTPDADMAEEMNAQFHAELWPSTANAIMPMGGAPFEVTFYVNATGTDITNIRPYAAYDLTHDQWTVHPKELPADWDPRLYFPKSWWDKIYAEEASARGYMQQFKMLRDAASQQPPNRGAWMNALVSMHHVLRGASDLFHSIHADRKQAFSADGKGYDDYYNFRWQAHKHLGTGPMLHQLAALNAEVHNDATTSCYAGQDLDAGHALRLAVKAAATRA